MKFDTFKSATLLPHWQLWVTVKGHPHTPNAKQFFITYFRPKGHWKLCNEVESLSAAKRLKGFKPVNF